MDFICNPLSYIEKLWALSNQKEHENSYYEHACIQSPFKNTAVNEYMDSNDKNVPQKGKKYFKCPLCTGIECSLHNQENLHLRNDIPLKYFGNHEPAYTINYHALAHQKVIS